MIAARLIIAGRVQGVGYRDWLVREAQALGIAGWVRNCASGEVEALLAGPPELLEQAISLCWKGPDLARVASITRSPAPLPGTDGFGRLPSVASPAPIG